MITVVVLHSGSPLQFQSKSNIPVVGVVAVVVVAVVVVLLPTQRFAATVSHHTAVRRYSFVPHSAALLQFRTTQRFAATLRTNSQPSLLVQPAPVAMAALIPRGIMARIGAVRVVLEQVKGTSTHAAISKLQRDAMIDLLGRQVLDVDTKASVSTELLQAQWAGDDHVVILNSLVAPAAVQASGGQKRRRSQQSYEAIVDYFTEESWEVLLGSDSGQVKLETILSTCCGVGLRCPTEPCLKLVTSLWILSSTDSSELLRLTRQQKSALFLHFKREFDKRRKALPDPTVYLQNLPPTPLRCLKDYPALYSSFYRDGAEPVPAKINMQSLIELDQSYSCRGGGSAATVVGSSTSTALAVPSLDSAGSNLGQIASVFMSHMQHMAESQQKMMESVLRGGVPTSSLSELAGAVPPTTSRSYRRLDSGEGTSPLNLTFFSPRPGNAPAEGGQQLSRMPPLPQGLDASVVAGASVSGDTASEAADQPLVPVSGVGASAFVRVKSEIGAAAMTSDAADQPSAPVIEVSASASSSVVSVSDGAARSQAPMSENLRDMMAMLEDREKEKRREAQEAKKAKAKAKAVAASTVLKELTTSQGPAQEAISERDQLTASKPKVKAKAVAASPALQELTTSQGPEQEAISDRGQLPASKPKAKVLPVASSTPPAISVRSCVCVCV